MNQYEEELYVEIIDLDTIMVIDKEEREAFWLLADIPTAAEHVDVLANGRPVAVDIVGPGWNLLYRLRNRGVQARGVRQIPAG